MRALLFLFFLLEGTLAIAQVDDLFCKQQLKALPYFIRHTDFFPTDSIEKDLQILIQCGQLDSTDSRIIEDSFLRELTYASPNKRAKLSYAVVLKKFKHYKKTDDYITDRKLAIAHVELEHAIATSANWETGKKYFNELGFWDETQLNELKEFIAKNNTAQFTFWQAYLKCFVKGS